MIRPRLFLCNGVELQIDDPRRDGRRITELASLGSDPNVYIYLEDVAKVFQQHLSPRLVDLLEIASYVYTADCATNRGKEWSDDDSTESWSRDFHFVIPVRDVDFWKRSDVGSLLKRILNFLSDDNYSFEFEELIIDREFQHYLSLGDFNNWPFTGVEKVFMFSGGLDSLAGAVEAASRGEQLVLVSHRPVSTQSKRLRLLFKELKALYPTQMIHIPVTINKVKDFGREYTQRTRSFLYSALGSAVAESVNANGVRFFENGVVSLNLPVADEVLRARASRTTHPIVLDMLSKLYSLILNRNFELDNPFLFKTKADIVSLIVECGGQKLIQHTCSCAHTAYKSKNQWHCGTCSQCIDRRIAILAAGQADNDPADDYVVDVFTGKRKEHYEQNMAVNYSRHAIELDRMSEQEIAIRFDLELGRAVRSFANRSAAAESFVQLHKRHAMDVCRVLDQQIEANASKIRIGELPNTSLLGMITGYEHLIPSWKRLANRVVNYLTIGIPIACKTHKPADEPHLQEICNAILKAHDNTLTREFPFMSWSVSLTKPDWSSEEAKLWIELKYIRKKADIRTSTEDIAADITKYGDNDRRILFVIYDPYHLIIDEHGFSEPILRRDTLQVAFIR